MEQITTEITKLTGLGAAFQLKVIQSFTVLLFVIVLNFLIHKLIWKRTHDVKKRYTWGKATSYSVTLIALVLVGRIWFQGISALVTYFGILSAGLAIALQDIVANFAGWVFILWRRPFSVGDRIQVGDCVGDVIDIRIFQFTLLEIGNWVDADQSTGRVVHVPNRDVLSKPLANYATGFEYIWDEVPVLLTFESDWRKAKEILTSIVKEYGESMSETAAERVRQASRRYMIFYNVLTPAVYTDVRDSGVLLTMRFLCAPRTRRSVREKMWEEILTRFEQHNDIDFAYPTQRFYDNRSEGKSAQP